MAPKTPKFIALGVNRTAWVSLRKDQASVSTFAPTSSTLVLEVVFTSIPKVRVVTVADDTAAPEKAYGKEWVLAISAFEKHKAPEIVDMDQGSLAKTHCTNVMRAWSEAITKGRSGIVSSTGHLHSLVPSNLDPPTMSLGHLGEERIQSILTVSILSRHNSLHHSS